MIRKASRQGRCFFPLFCTVLLLLRQLLLCGSTGVAEQKSSHKQPAGQRAWKQNKKGQKRLKGNGLQSGKGRARPHGTKGTKDAKKKIKKRAGGGGSGGKVGSKAARRFKN